MRRQGSGQALVEYVVLLALGSLVAIGVVTIAGSQLSEAYQQVGAILANPAAAIAGTASPTPTPMAPATSRATAESTPTPAPTPAAPQTPVLAPATTAAAQTEVGPNSGGHAGAGDQTGAGPNANTQR